VERPVLLVLVIASAMVSSCVRAPVKPIEWPVDVPPLSYYEKIYEQDEDNREIQPKDKYLTWVIRFYKGWKLYEHGWHSTTQNILYSVEDASKKARMETKLSHLGKLISAEWAKDSPDRLIRSRELSIWGQALLASIDQKNEESLVDLVTRDVTCLLTGKLEPDRIALNRYRSASATTHRKSCAQAGLPPPESRDLFAEYA
jgi:hypothetical protein